MVTAARCLFSGLDPISTSHVCMYLLFTSPVALSLPPTHAHIPNIPSSRIDPSFLDTAGMSQHPGTQRLWAHYVPSPNERRRSRVGVHAEQNGAHDGGKQAAPLLSSRPPCPPSVAGSRGPMQRHWPKRFCVIILLGILTCSLAPLPPLHSPCCTPLSGHFPRQTRTEHGCHPEL